MAKYLDLDGLTEVAEKVNQKLKTVTTMPASANINDVVLYKGPTTADYQQGGIYVYILAEIYYAWTDLTNTYYTKSATPAVGDAVYTSADTISAYTIESYDAIQNKVEINNLTYDRALSRDINVNKWVYKSGSSVVLNGEDKSGDQVDFYAPTASGTSGQVLISNGQNNSPSWSFFQNYTPSVINDTLCFSYDNSNNQGE